MMTKARHVLNCTDGRRLRKGKRSTAAVAWAAIAEGLVTDMTTTDFATHPQLASFVLSLLYGLSDRDLKDGTARKPVRLGRPLGIEQW